MHYIQLSCLVLVPISQKPMKHVCHPTNLRLLILPSVSVLDPEKSRLVPSALLPLIVFEPVVFTFLEVFIVTHVCAVGEGDLLLGVSLLSLLTRTYHLQGSSAYYKSGGLMRRPV